MDAFFEYIVKYVQLLRISDFIDIFIVSVILYYMINLIRETRAMQLVKGIIFLFLAFFVSQWLKLNALNYILGGAMQIGAFAIVVIFQPELRNLLERMGRFKVGNIIDFAGTTTDEEQLRVIESVALAASNMADSRTGALIVMERMTRLGEFISTGTMLDANVSSGLLENIFVPNTPLHDGAVVIRNNKIVTAGCIHPLTANNNLSR
ncbi:MAG: diadenylate cyclase, partial [Clostridia bacterium]|nr:diadenylate cyclase [Clostridia bacterium]